jgi:signal transduction histidine kinase
MSLDGITHGWLEIGTDFKRGERHKERSKRLGRMPLGEKGVGRLALQKLGDRVQIITKAKDSPEYKFSVDWTALITKSKYLDGGLTVSIEENSHPKIFSDTTGTLIRITKLRRSEWARKEIRDLYRLVTSLSNPFDEVESFSVSLSTPGREDDIADLPTVKDMLDTAVWHFEFKLNAKGILLWKYQFSPPRFKGLKPRETEGNGRLELVPSEADAVLPKGRQVAIFLDPSDLDDIGPIQGNIYAFHRRSEILKESGSIAQMKAWLDGQTGVRIYRDGVRVFNYGEPGDDWLGLNARRINRPTGKLGTQNVVAHIALDLSQSQALKEKTNREGFDENDAFRRLRRTVLSIFDKFEREHAPDREAIDKVLKNEQSVPGIQEAMQKLEALGKQHKIENEVKPLVRSIQVELDRFRDLMISSGMAGMNLALVFHEVVHAIDSITRQLDRKDDISTIRREVDHVRKLLDTFKPLLQRERVRKITARELIDRASRMHEDRFKRHNIVFSNWIADPLKCENFPITGPLNLLVGALSNALDNAIYWTRHRMEGDGLTEPRGILALSDWDDAAGGMIAIVDGGPGFQLPIDQIATPFRSTRAGGMGLGLYYCKLVMESLGGQLQVVSAEEMADEFKMPAAYDGAAVIFKFKGTEQ